MQLQCKYVESPFYRYMQLSYPSRSEGLDTGRCMEEGMAMAESASCSPEGVVALETTWRRSRNASKPCSWRGSFGRNARAEQMLAALVRLEHLGLSRTSMGASGCSTQSMRIPSVCLTSASMLLHFATTRR